MISGTIPTATGPIAPEQLGFTLMHEHTVITSPGMIEAYPHLYDRKAITRTLIDGFLEAKAAGIGTIVDCTTPDLGRDPLMIMEAATIAGLQVVLCTGIWRDVPRWFQARDADAAAELFIRELEDGIADTGVRAGIIKVASHEVVTEPQESILRAAARAARATGATITTHTLAPARTGLRQLEVLAEESMPMDRVIIGHSSCTDREYLAQLYASGSYVSWDQFGLPGEIGDEAAVLATLIEFLQQGRADRTLLSGDYGPFVDWDLEVANGYGHVPGVVIPKLLEAGVSQDDIDTMTVHSPARLLTRVARIAPGTSHTPSEAG
jgi:phosphotriesterase-related protein